MQMHSVSIDPEKPIFVVSDLHLGDGGARDNFAFDKKEDKFNSFLDYVEHHNGQLIILGDMFDFWQGHVADVIVRYMHLLDRLSKITSLYVIGNHDWDLHAFIGTGMLKHPFFKVMQGPAVIEISHKTFKFMHGHEVEPFDDDRRPGWARIIAILGGILEDRKGSPILSAGGKIERMLISLGRTFMWIWNFSVNRLERPLYASSGHNLESELTPSQSPSKVPEMLKLFENNRRKEGYDIVVAGHTHKASHSDSWYYNSGCWVGLRSNFLKITHDGKVHIFDWQDGHPHKWE